MINYQLLNRIAFSHKHIDINNGHEYNAYFFSVVLELNEFINDVGDEDPHYIFASFLAQLNRFAPEYMSAFNEFYKRKFVRRLYRYAMYMIEHNLYGEE